MSAAGETTTSYDDVNLGRVEGAQAATTSTTDSTIHNITGINTGHVAQQVSIHDSMIHNQTGVVEGQMAKTTSEDDTYYHYNNMYYKIPESAIIMRNTQNEFTGYQNSAGETIMLNTMTGLNQSQFAALHIGKYEGVQAAMTSMHDSTSQNQVGVNAGSIGQIKGAQA